MVSGHRGISYPECAGDHKVVDSRAKGDYIYRRRKCLDCGCRFSTDERITGHRHESEADAFADELQQFAEICRRNPRVLRLIEAYQRGEVLIVDRSGEMPFLGS